MKPAKKKSQKASSKRTNRKPNPARIAPIQTIANGNRTEIALETPDERSAFLAFLKEAIRGLDSDIRTNTLSYVEEKGTVDLRSFARYFYEGWLKYDHQTTAATYQASGLKIETLQNLLDVSQFKGLKGIDFGFGNGEVQETLAAQGAKVVGFDLNPFFVQAARLKGHEAFVAEIDKAPEKFLKDFGALPAQDFILATLVLDRLKNPLFFLSNFFSFLKHQGSFALQTLLPIIPKDDGPVKNPIIYTEASNRLTPGKNEDEDRIHLMQILEKITGAPVQVSQVPYTVKSLDGMQNYLLWSFFGKKG